MISERPSSILAVVVVDVVVSYVVAPAVGGYAVVEVKIFREGFDDGADFEPEGQPVVFVVIIVVVVFMALTENRLPLESFHFIEAD